MRVRSAYDGGVVWKKRPEKVKSIVITPVPERSICEGVATVKPIFR